MTTPSSDVDADIHLSIPDIACQGFVETVQAGLLSEGGIQNVEGDAKAKTAHVTYKSWATSPERIETAITGLGFRVRRDEEA